MDTRTWKQKGAPGCPKCRYVGCKRCYDRLTTTSPPTEEKEGPRVVTPTKSPHHSASKEEVPAVRNDDNSILPEVEPPAWDILLGDDVAEWNDGNKNVRHVQDLQEAHNNNSNKADDPNEQEPEGSIMDCNDDQDMDTGRDEETDVDLEANDEDEALSSDSSTVQQDSNPADVSDDLFGFPKSPLGGYLTHKAIDSDDEDAYLVDKLVDVRRSKSGRFEFLVRWVGYPTDTWEPQANLMSSLDDEVGALLAEFEGRLQDDGEMSGDTISAVGKPKKKRSLQKTTKDPTTPKRRKTITSAKRGSSNKTGRQVLRTTPSPFAVADANATKVQETFSRIPMCLAQRIFGGRLRRVTECPLKDPIPTSVQQSSETWALLGTKIQQKTGFREAIKQTLYYVVEQAPGVESISLQGELNKLADFAAIKTSNKVASRLELLFTDAKLAGGSKMPGYRIIEHLTPDDFEEIEEVDHIGCGFIPKAMLRDFLGNGAKGTSSSSIQVRILVPKLGLFKGTLQVKLGIRRIQLPSSMKKVGPSRSNERKDLACVLIRAIFPSDRNIHVSKILRNEPISDSAKVNLQTGKRGPLSEMICCVLQEAGVALNDIEKYKNKIRFNGRAVQHTTVVGLCDPTEGRAIPTGYVFLTGIAGCKVKMEKVVVARFPCTSRYDQTTLQVLKKKPIAMSKEDWNDLTQRKFGEIIFGRPKEGNVPIPETIAGGDLDGDPYFVTWYRPFLEQTLKHSKNDQVRAKPAMAEELVVRNHNWLKDAWDFMCDTEAQSSYPVLIGRLHKQWKTLVGQQSRDAEAFGEAFKRSLEIKKHGGKVFLPGHLWDMMAPSIHKFLTARHN